MIKKLKQIIKDFIEKHIVCDDPRESSTKYEKLLKKIYEEEKEYRHGRDV